MKPLICAALALSIFVPATALAAPLDDSASPRQRIEAKPRWQYDGEDALSPERIGRMVVDVPNVEFRLNTASWQGKAARIYLTLPPLVPGVKSPEGMRVEWRARQFMQSGTVVPGGRVLVFDGTVERAQTVEFFDFTIQLDTRFTHRGIRFEPKFEIEAR
jgi:hypothetical protein